MGKWTDKLYITHGEWAADFGGAKAAPRKYAEGYHLPFGCCNRSFSQLFGKGSAPGVQPMLDTITGLLYDKHAISSEISDSLTNETDATTEVSDQIIDGSHAPCQDKSTDKRGKSRFIPIKWEIDPVTHEPICPVSRRTLTDHLPIVAIRTSGWLYDAETIQQLNVSRRNFIDLVTGISFTSADIIRVITGVASVAKNQPQNISKLGNRQPLIAIAQSAKIPAASPSPSIDRIFRSIREKPSALQAECRKLGLEKMQLRHLPSNITITCPGAAPMPSRDVYAPPLSTRGTRGAVSASFTSTAMSIATRNEELVPRPEHPASKRTRR
ncbi:cyclophilin peptidyl-prolyl cis-trans isomerase Cyp8 [Mitosporidium daphniae]|uniref:Uncharacterized protein n=1 Tax=Mitosporidium daphniae TaxID=1485682 RepID=A0A098VSQ8_9MICR|nr:uncharacterized protein DI09_26p140 [Mitosporidium daphniae]KGG51814.1 hypothetical protein DI09_26p140 [Mitosporidium daphniae]|eukprot:XP_013238241.1 uncharacterized protein DI09_26p140 [Mitosporidium daphniae]